MELQPLPPLLLVKKRHGDTSINVQYFMRHITAPTADLLACAAEVYCISCRLCFALNKGPCVLEIDESADNKSNYLDCGQANEPTEQLVSCL